MSTKTNEMSKAMSFLKWANFIESELRRHLKNKVSEELSSCVVFTVCTSETWYKKDCFLSAFVVSAIVFSNYFLFSFWLKWRNHFHSKLASTGRIFDLDFFENSIIYTLKAMEYCSPVTIRHLKSNFERVTTRTFFHLKEVGFSDDYEWYSISLTSYLYYYDTYDEGVTYNALADLPLPNEFSVLFGIY